MKKLEAHTEEAGKEKHVPVVKNSGEEIKIKVDSIEHPMEENHYIAFIEVLTKDYVLRKKLKAGEKLEGQFWIQKGETVEVRAYCNLHGLWKSKE